MPLEQIVAAVPSAWLAGETNVPLFLQALHEHLQTASAHADFAAAHGHAAAMYAIRPTVPPLGPADA